MIDEMTRARIRKQLNIMAKPELTRKRIIAAYAVAVVADLIEFPISAANSRLLEHTGESLRLLWLT